MEAIMQITNVQFVFKFIDQILRIKGWQIFKYEFNDDSL